MLPDLVQEVVLLYQMFVTVWSWETFSASACHRSSEGSVQHLQVSLLEVVVVPEAVGLFQDLQSRTTTCCNLSLGRFLMFRVMSFCSYEQDHVRELATDLHNHVRRVLELVPD